MNIMVLGATGYLGSNIVYRLAKANYNMYCVVRKTSNTSRIENIEGVTLVLNDLDNIEKVFKHCNIDWVINSACAYSANNNAYGDLLTSNIFFPLEVLNIAINHKVTNFMTMGTSLPENTNLYSFTKHKYAEFGEYFCKNTGINFADLKLEMFYGGLYEPDDRFISACCKRLELGLPVPLTVGKQKRDIIRVEDVVSIIEKIIASNFLKGYMSLPVGSGEHHSIIEILKFMKKIMNSDSELRFGDIITQNREPDTLADISWYRNIDYNMKYSYFEGLQMRCTRLLDKI